MTLYLNDAYQEPPPTPVATVVPSVGNWEARGCYADSTTARSLTGGSTTDSAMTVSKCVGLAKGWKYAGVENESYVYSSDTFIRSC